MTPNLVRFVSAACLAAVILPAQHEEGVILEVSPRVAKTKKASNRSSAEILKIVERLSDDETSSKDRKKLKKALLKLIGDVKTDALLEARPITRTVTKSITESLKDLKLEAGARVKILDQDGNSLANTKDEAIAIVRRAYAGLGDDEIGEIEVVVEQGQGKKNKNKNKSKNKAKGEKKLTDRLRWARPDNNGGKDVFAWVVDSDDGEDDVMSKGDIKKAIAEAKRALAKARIGFAEGGAAAVLDDVTIEIPEINVNSADPETLKALFRSVAQDPKKARILKGKASKGGSFFFDGGDAKKSKKRGKKAGKGKKNGFTFEWAGEGEGREITVFGKDGKKEHGILEFLVEGGSGKGKSGGFFARAHGEAGAHDGAEHNVWVERALSGKGKKGIWSVDTEGGHKALLKLVERAQGHAEHEHEEHVHEEHEHEEVEECEECEEEECEEEGDGAEEILEMIEEMRAEMRELREMMEEIRNSLRGNRTRTRRGNRRVGQVVPLSTREERVLPTLARKVR